MKNKFIRILSPITLAVVGVLDVGVIVYAVYAVKKLMQEVNTLNIIFAIIDIVAIIVAVLVSKEVVSNGVKFKECEVEFTALDDNNIFKYADIEKIESSKDVKASLTKNFVDRYSRLTIYLTDESIVTIDLGLTTKKALNKVVKELNERIKKD